MSSFLPPSHLHGAIDFSTFHDNERLCFAWLCRARARVSQQQQQKKTTNARDALRLNVREASLSLQAALEKRAGGRERVCVGRGGGGCEFHSPHYITAEQRFSCLTLEQIQFCCHSSFDLRRENKINKINQFLRFSEQNPKYKTSHRLSC